MINDQTARPEKVVTDGGIIKHLLKCGTSSETITWEKGSRAMFHYRTFMYVSEDQERELREKHNCDHGKDPEKKQKLIQERVDMIKGMLNGEPESDCHNGDGEKEHDHEHSKGGCCDRSHSHGEAATATPEGKPIRRKIGDSRKWNIDSKPFDIKMGYSFSVKAIEPCLQSMKIGEVSKFLCFPQYTEGYLQMENLVRKSRQNHDDLQNGFLQTQRSLNKSMCAGSILSGGMFGGSGGGVSAELEDTLSIGNAHLLTELLYTYPLEIELELISVEPPTTASKETWECSLQEKWENGRTLKESGNALYKAGKASEAADVFARAIMMLESLTMSTELSDYDRELEEHRSSGSKEAPPQPPIAGFDNAEMKTLLNTLRLNYSACKLKTKDYASVILQCTEVIKNDPPNVKAYFRRGTAYVGNMGSRDLDLAERDLQTSLRILEKSGLPEITKSQMSTEIKAQLKIVDQKLAKIHEREKRMFKDIFA